MNKLEKFLNSNNSIVGGGRLDDLSQSTMNESVRGGPKPVAAKKKKGATTFSDCEDASDIDEIDQKSFNHSVGNDSELDMLLNSDLEDGSPKKSGETSKPLSAKKDELN